MKTRMFCCSQEGCNKSFRDEDSLKKHLESHEEDLLQPEKKHVCRKCLREFSTRQSLKEHMYTHSCKKTFKCPEPGCGKAFRQSSQLCNHKKIHIEMRQMIVRKNEQDGKTRGLLEDLAVKVKSGEVEEFAYFKLPPIRHPESGIILPKLESLYRSSAENGRDKENYEEVQQIL